MGQQLLSSPIKVCVNCPEDASFSGEEQLLKTAQVNHSHSEQATLDRNDQEIVGYFYWKEQFGQHNNKIKSTATKK